MGSTPTVTETKAEIMKNSRRRAALRFLLEEDVNPDSVYESHRVREISEWIDEREGQDKRESIYNTLSKNHLPYMEDEGFVEYDDDRKIVDPGPRLNELKRLLDEKPLEHGDFEISAEDLFHLLSNDRRRKALHYMKEQEERPSRWNPLGEVYTGEPYNLNDMVDQIADWKGEDVKQDSIYSALHQSHLPELDKNHVIEYRREESTIERGVFFDPVVSYLPEPDFTD